jgi:hypothetical protein
MHRMFIPWALLGPAALDAEQISLLHSGECFKWYNIDQSISTSRMNFVMVHSKPTEHLQRELPACTDSAVDCFSLPHCMDPAVGFQQRPLHKRIHGLCTHLLGRHTSQPARTTTWASLQRNRCCCSALVATSTGAPPLPPCWQPSLTSTTRHHRHCAPRGLDCNPPEHAVLLHAVNNTLPPLHALLLLLHNTHADRLVPAATCNR